MSDHVRVGEVQDDQVVLAGPDRCHRLRGQFRRRHLRLQIIGRDLGGGDHDAVLAGIGRLLAAVEEIGDVRIFLGLRHAQLAQARLRGRLAQPLRQGLGREQGRHHRVQLGAVGGHADGAGELRPPRPGEALEVRLQHGVEDLADAVRAEVEAEEPVAILHAGIGADHGGHDELVGHTLGIGAGDGALRIGEVPAFAQYHRLPGLRDTLPAIVAVHGEVAARDGGDHGLGRQARPRNRRYSRLPIAAAYRGHR